MDRQRLLALAEKCGIKSELADQLFTVMEDEVKTEKARLHAEYEAKKEEAKRICLEEVEANNRELARRLQIFCEAKGRTIEQAIAKQSALRESEALTKLHEIHNLLEGVGQNGDANGGSPAEIQKLKRELRRLSEENQRQVAAANRATALAEKVLKRNRIIEGRLSRARREPVQESRQPAPGLDRQRAARPTTTRPTLVENQDRRPPRPPAAPAPAGTDGFSPQSIAEHMEVDLI